MEDFFDVNYGGLLAIIYLTGKLITICLSIKNELFFICLCNNIYFLSVYITNIYFVSEFNSISSFKSRIYAVYKNTLYFKFFNILDNFSKNFILGFSLHLLIWDCYGSLLICALWHSSTSMYWYVLYDSLNLMVLFLYC